MCYFVDFRRFYIEYVSKELRKNLQMQIAQKLDVIGKNGNQIWKQHTKVSLNQMSNLRRQKKTSKLFLV